MKNSSKKAFFFDFDGTLWFGKYGEKTLEGLKKLHSDGHLLFYNSGRSKGHTHHDKLAVIPFDGFLYGGNHAEIFGETVYRNDLSRDLIEVITHTEKDFNLDILYEGVISSYKHTNFPFKCHGIEFDDTSEILNVEKYPVTKFCIFKKWITDEKSGLKSYFPLDEKANAILSEYFHVIDLDFYYECILKNTGKDFIVKKTLEFLKMDIEDCYFFGDSLNDLSVFKIGGTNVAIAHSPSELKKFANFITTEEENGVYESLLYYGFIKE